MNSKVLIESNNVRLAKNTLSLYFRMLFMMLVNLYTSRVVLNTLGVEDFGIYNVVGGIISSFAFINGAMASSTQRYLTFELEKGNIKKMREIFSVSLIIHISIAALIFIISETIGMWFLKTHMTIPIERLNAAYWVYHFSMLSLVIIIVGVPYNAVIVSHEKMKAFAFISIIEAVLKLCIVYILQTVDYDKLKIYSILHFLIQLLTRLTYINYCKNNFLETHFKIQIQKRNIALAKEMSGFAGWNLFGNFAAMTFIQGLNILLNVFFGPTVNAARGIAVQVQGVVSQFFTNFQMAINPQITKSYASGNVHYLHRLIYSSSKFTFFLMLILCLPIFIKTKYVLSLWLQVIPEYADTFLRIILISSVVDAISNPIIISVMATGKVKLFEITVGIILLFILPASYLALKLGAPPYSVFIIHLVFCCIAYIARLLIFKVTITFDLKGYFNEVVKRCFVVLVLSILVPTYIASCLADSFLSLIIISVLSTLSTIFIIYIVGLNSDERQVVNNKLNLFKLNLKSSFQ